MASLISSYGIVKSSSGKLCYEQEGNKDGPAVLFIHGLGGTTNTYQPLLSSLQDFRLVRFDWAGHGRSSVPQKTSIDSYVEDAEGKCQSTKAIPEPCQQTAAVIKYFDLKDATVVGHSLGCLVAMTQAAKQAFLVSRLILSGPVKSLLQVGRDGAKGRAENVRKGGMATMADTVIGNAFAAGTLKDRPKTVAFGRELLCRQDAEGYALVCLALAESKDPDWSAIKAQTTLISGSEDKISTPALYKIIAKFLGHTTVNLVTFEGVGHWHTLENSSEREKVLKNTVKS